MRKKFLSALLCTTMAAALLTACGSKDTTTNNAKSDGTAKKESDGVSGDDTGDDTASKDDAGKQDVSENGTEDTGDTPGGGRTIALSMPTQSAQRWIDDAANMKLQLEAKGYQVETQFADDDPQQQVAQIEKFIEDGVDCLVITPVDSRELVGVEASARDAGIPVIGYDRLLMDTDAISCYVSFDNKGVGNAIGRTIVEKAGLDDLADGDYKTIEFFMGSPDDNNSIFIYNGLMEVLQPYLDDGRLVCKTERTSFEDTCILRWSKDTAQEWCGNFLAGYYVDEDLDICATAFDGLAYGCKAALLSAGYTEGNWPVISGQDCEVMACKDILDGTQAFSVYKDTRILAEKCVMMIDAVVNGTDLEINDTEQYHNNVMAVPSYLCDPVVVDKDNLQEVIIDSGYYTEDMINSVQ